MKGSDTIAFRLPSELLTALAERGSVHGVSAHQFARILVIEALVRGGEASPFIATLDAVAKDTDALRGDVAFLAKTIRLGLGQCTEAEADAWVARNFKR